MNRGYRSVHRPRRRGGVPRTGCGRRPAHTAAGDHGGLPSGDLSIIDSTTGAILSSTNLGSDTIDVTVTPDGSMALVTSFGSQRLTFVDLTTSPPTSTGFVSIPFAAEDVEVSCANSGYAVITDGGGSPYVVSVDLNAQAIVNTLTLPYPSTGECNAVSPDGSMVLVGSWWYGTVRLLRMSPTGFLTDTGWWQPIGAGCHNVTFMPDGRRALITSWTNGLTVLDVTGGVLSIVGQVPTSGGATQSVVIAPSGTRAYVLHCTSNVVEALDIDAAGNFTSAGTAAFSGSTPLCFFGVDQLAVSPDDLLLYVRRPFGLSIIDTVGLVEIDTLGFGGSWGAGVATLCTLGVMADRLAFESQPDATEVQGETWTPFTVSVRDQNGDLFTDAADPVTASLFTGEGVLSGTTTKTPSGGLVTFDDLSYDTAETISLVVTSPGLLAVGAQVIVTPANSDLRITPADITLTPSGAGHEVGLSTQIDAEVHNVGSAAATTTVQFWLGDPDIPAASAQLLSTQAGSVPLGGSTVFSTGWTPTVDGLQSLFVVVDNTTPGGADTNPADNRATVQASVGAAAEELAITAGERVAWPGAQASVPVTVTNIGYGPATITGQTFGPPGWVTPVTALTGLTLEPGESILALVQLDVPATATGAPLGGAPNVQLVPIALDTASGTFSSDLVVKLFDQAASTVTVRVVDDADSSPLANALVSAQEVPGTSVTGAPNGETTLQLPPGPNGIFAFRTGYIAQAGTFDIPEGASTVELRLTAGQTLSVDQVVSEPLSTQEILDRGVDVNDPVNNTIFDFTVSMNIGEPLVIRNVELPKTEPTTGTTTFSQVIYPTIDPDDPNTNRGNGLGGGTLVTGRFDYHAYGRTETWIIIPGEVWVLKQFFEVTTFVFNNASAPNPEDVQLQSVMASLNVPAGLALPDLDGSPQDVTQDLGTLDAQEGAEAVWIVRGDQPGSYQLNGLVTADLYAFGAFQTDLSALATSDPFDVDVPRIRCEFLTPGAVLAGAPFSFGVLVTNQAASPAQLVRVILEEADLINCTLVGTESLQDAAVSFAYDGGGGVVSATYTIGDLDPATSGLADFQLISEVSGIVQQLSIENGCGAAPSPPVEVVPDPPTIVAQPDPVTACDGEAIATFQVTADGFAPITYQWRKDGVDIPGETGVVLSIANVSLADAGSYDVVVTNPGGETTSDPALLTVHTGPTIQAAPMDTTVCEGSGDVVFAVTATGEPAPSYQWYLNEVALPGAVFSSYAVASPTPADDGSYKVVVSNACGSVEATAGLTVHVAPTISTELADQMVTEDSDATFTVVASGVPAPTYSWTVDGNPIAGETGPSLTLSDVEYSDMGTYEVTVTNACGSVTSSAALSVNRKPVFTCTDPFELWSPQHDLVDVSSVFSVSDPDGDPVNLSIRVFSDETEIPDTGDGTGKHAPDFKNELNGGRGLLLRSERRGKEDGRWYVLVLTADDGQGGVLTIACGGGACPKDQSATSMADVMGQLATATARYQAAIDAAGPGGLLALPLAGDEEHGLSAPLGPKQ